MLLGSTGRLAASDLTPLDRDATQVRLTAPDVSLTLYRWGVATLDGARRWATDPATGSWIAYSGHLLPDDAALSNLDPGAVADLLLTGLRERGYLALESYDGTFALAWFDATANRLHLICDRFGVEPLYYADLGHSVVFASRLRDLRSSGYLLGGLSGQGLVEFLTYCWVPSTATLDRGALRVGAGQAAEIAPGRGVVQISNWYRLSFSDPFTGDERHIAEGFRDMLQRAVVRRLGPLPVGVLLSGGMDSSSVLAFARQHEAGEINTYAFRCEGHTFDESYFSRALSDELRTRHTEVNYGEPEALLQEELAGEMEVPFCDIGINVGTWLTTRAARGEVSYVLTGDGGDEMWASHPVYAAQRLLRPYDRLPIPGVVRRTLRSAADLLHDSDEKRDIRVALKRILPLDGLPREMAHWRWRSYYGPGDLQSLLTPDAAQMVRGADPYDPVIRGFDGYRGPDDGISPMLYSDYFMMSRYYFDRTFLGRRFGVEARLPFYDRQLVEYGARIPAHLKLEGVERTKRLFRVAMEHDLSSVIRDRKTKLGNSIPLKNWFRSDGPVSNWVRELTTLETVRRRGLFRPEVVHRLFDEHRRRRHNHSHRLWAIATLEAWLRHAYDKQPMRTGAAGSRVEGAV